MTEKRQVVKKKTIVSKDMAEEEFQRFVDSMVIDVDETDMDAEDLTAFRKQKKKIINAICNGSLIFNENGEAVYTPQRSPIDCEITFHERTGASIMAMNGMKKNYDVAKMYAVMADMTKVPSTTFAKMKGIDIKICEAIFALLMD